MRLTEEQCKVVEENHNLIYWYIKERRLELSEWYDLLAIELCYTAMKYDKSRGSFANYFKLRADGVVYKEIRKAMSQKRYAETVPLDESIQVEQYMDVCSDQLSGILDMEDLRDGYFGDIIKLKAEGYTQTEISKKLGISQSYVSNIIKRIKEKYDQVN